jgi:hypothetical protein
MKLACIAIPLVLLAGDAWSDPVRSRILDELNVSRTADGWNVEVAFQVPVRVLRHTPLEKGDEVLVFVELLAVSPDDIVPAFGRESLRIPPGAGTFLRSVVFDGERAEGPLVEIRFASPHEFEIATGRDLRSFTMRARPVARTAQRPTPSSASPSATAPSAATSPAARTARPAPQPRPGRALSDAEVDRRLDEARRAIERGEPALAVSYLTPIAAGPERARSAEAQELLGVAREKNGQLAHAKAEYEAYLDRYPGGEGADRVRQRLRALLTARAVPKARRKRASSFSWEREVDVDLAGSMSLTYERAAQLPPDGTEHVSRSALYSDLNATARLTTKDYTLRGRFSGRFGEDLRKGRETRVSSLFAELADRAHGVEAVLGRQSRSSGGVLGRFDGGNLAIDLPFGMRGYATAGMVVDSSRDLDWQPDRHFYGVSLDLPRWREKLDTQIYIVRQMVAGMTDRFAIGSESRYVGTRGFAALFLDYDLHFEALNTAYLVANWRPRDRLQLNLLANHRTSPILLTRSALSGQGVDQLQDVIDRYGEDALRQIAEDRTARTTNLSVGSTYRLSSRFQVASDLSATYSSGTRSSAGVIGFESTGWELSPSLQLMANDLFKAGDVAVATLRHRHESSAETITASLLTRVPVGPLRVGPTVRVDYRMADTSPDLLVVRPLVRCDLRFWDFVLDTELGFEWRKQELGVAADDLGYNMRISLRRNF